MCLTPHAPRKHQLPKKVMHLPLKQQYKQQPEVVVSPIQDQPQQHHQLQQVAKRQLLRQRRQQTVAAWKPDEAHIAEHGPTDWTIQVACNEGIVSQSYRVHESVITSGRASRCGYFDKLFQNKAMIRGSGTNTIPVQLERRAADLFPTFLDYLYCSPRFQVTTSNAMGLRHIAEVFKVPKMKDSTWKFIKKDMGLHNLEHYLRDAKHFGDSQTATWVAYECAKRITHLHPDSVVLRNLTPDDFKQAIFVARLSHKGTSDHWSELVAGYCSHNLKDLDERWFRNLTNEENLPGISRSAAMKLLEVEFFVLKKSSTGMSGIADSNYLSSLQRRCVQAMSGQSEAPAPVPQPPPQIVQQMQQKRQQDLPKAMDISS